MIRFLQTNLNHCKAAQDLLTQTEIEKSICISIIAEPYTIPNDNTWMSSTDSRAAIHVTTNMSTPSILRKRGRFSVGAQWMKLTIILVYISPNADDMTYEFLDELDVCVQEATEDILICGDFNSKAILWGCNHNNSRGDRLTRWSASKDMNLVNIGNKPTCARCQGTSVVDITWCSSTLRPHVENWIILDEETLSDHVYIRFDINYSKKNYIQKRKKYVRWSHKKLQEDMYREAIEWSCVGPALDTYIHNNDTESAAKWAQDVISDACDFSMPRARPYKKNSAYWWNQKIYDLRKECQ